MPKTDTSPGTSYWDSPATFDPNRKPPDYHAMFQAGRYGSIPANELAGLIASRDQQYALSELANRKPGEMGGRMPHGGFGQPSGTPYIRPDTGASQANMIQAMKAQQMRDSAAANRQARGDEQFKRQQWEQLMQMMQMLIGGGGNQITPPSMGGFNSGQYNMRPPAGEIL